MKHQNKIPYSEYWTEGPLAEPAVSHPQPEIMVAIPIHRLKSLKRCRTYSSTCDQFTEIEEVELYPDQKPAIIYKAIKRGLLKVIHAFFVLRSWYVRIEPQRN